jgi:hypothetical protein
MNGSLLAGYCGLITGIALLVLGPPAESGNFVSRAPVLDHAVNGSIGRSSINWSGYVTPRDIFNPSMPRKSGVGASWKVPSAAYVSYNNNQRTTEVAVVWIGIGGWPGPIQGDLIQIGTLSAANSTNQNVYYGWYELLGQMPRTRLTNCLTIGTALSVTCTVSPNDFIEAYIQYSGSGTLWYLELVDYSALPDPWTFDTAVHFKTDAYTAEWIVEAPSLLPTDSPISNEIYPLPNYSNVVFSDAWASTSANTYIDSITPAEDGLYLTDHFGGTSYPCGTSRTTKGSNPPEYLFTLKVYYGGCL